MNEKIDVHQTLQQVTTALCHMHQDREKHNAGKAIGCPWERNKMLIRR